MIPLHLIQTKQLPILEQLKLEEALLHNDIRNFCLINEGSNPAIVMGISEKKEELINEALLNNNPLPLIKRFSGGGTVVVDENTIFVTFLFSKKDCSFSLFPDEIFQFTYQFYQKVFEGSSFSYQERDFVLGDKKCAGNAQYIKKDRWLQHTSFLWNYDQKKMDYLLLPKKTPLYRNKRSHKDFLCPIKNAFNDKNGFIEAIRKNLSKNFSLQEISYKEVSDHSSKRRSTCLVS